MPELSTSTPSGLFKARPLNRSAPPRLVISIYSGIGVGVGVGRDGVGVEVGSGTGVSVGVGDAVAVGDGVGLTVGADATDVVGMTVSRTATGPDGPSDVVRGACTIPTNKESAALVDAVNCAVSRCDKFHQRKYGRSRLCQRVAGVH